MGMKEVVSGNYQDSILWNEICNSYDSEQAEWVETLRAEGFKAAHPNDGWIDRENNTLRFMFAQFNDGAGVGDLVMIGRHGRNGSRRPVRITGMVDGYSDRFNFVDA